MVGVAFDERGDRAQLILVGAVAIAFIVLGLAVVFNTVLYTENVASTGAASAPRDAQILNQEIRVSVVGLIQRVNEGPRWSDDDDGSEDIQDGVESNLSVYSEGLMNVTARNSPALVSVEHGDPGKMTYAAFVEDSEGDFAGDSGSETKWQVTSGDEGAHYREFEMTVEPSLLEDGDSEDYFRLMWNETNANENYTVWVYAKSDDDIAITTLGVSGGDPTDFSAGTECVFQDSESGEVTIDFSNGSVGGEYSCPSLDISDQIAVESARTLQFANADEVSGSYSFVAWRDEPDPATYMSSNVDDSSSLPFTGGITDADTPYWSYAAWEFEVVTTYESGSISFSERQLIEVYNRSR